MKQHQQPTANDKSQQDNLRFMDDRIQFLDAIREIVHDEVKNKDSPPSEVNAMTSRPPEKSQRPKLCLWRSLRDLFHLK